MDEQEYERFEVTDYDLENEFNPNRYRKKLSKQQTIYGKNAKSTEVSENFINLSFLKAFGRMTVIKRMKKSPRAVVGGVKDARLMEPQAVVAKIIPPL